MKIKLLLLLFVVIAFGKPVDRNPYCDDAVRIRSGPYYGRAQILGFVLSWPNIPTTMRIFFLEFDTSKVNYTNKVLFENSIGGFNSLLCDSGGHNNRLNASLVQDNNGKLVYRFRFYSNTIDEYYEKLVKLVRNGVDKKKVYPFLYDTDASLLPNVSFFDVSSIQTTASTVMFDPYYFDGRPMCN